MDALFKIRKTRFWTAATSILSMLAALPSLGQTATGGLAYSVVDRGGFYRVLQRNIAVTNNGTGEVSQQVESYTELENGMNYLSNGVWTEAQDLIEPSPSGATAVHGQMTANLSGDITSAGAISLATATELYQSHPIGLFYADSASGKVAQIGSVQSSVGTLYPPNVVVFSNVLSGLSADLMLVWTRQGFEQNLVLKQSPPPPSSFGLSSDTTTLQLWSAMDSCPAPKEQRPVVLGSGLVDHILIFGSTWFPVGSAFSFGNTPLPPAGQAAQIHLLSPSDPGSVPVAKSLENIAGQQVLVEEIRYADLASALNQLPQASVSPVKSLLVELADRGRFLSPHTASKSRAGPLQVASGPYSPRGVVLDYTTLSGTASSYTFTSGTYYIPTSFYVGPNSVTFQANACLKFSNSWLIVYGPLSFPSSGQVVFTSKDDNSYGYSITSSTANPQYSASKELWIYYPTFSTTVQNSLFRWASIAIEYDENASDNYGHTLSSSVFQDCNTGVYMNMQSDTLTLTSDSYCNVTTPVQTDQYHGTVSGSMTYDCGVLFTTMVNDPNRDLSGLDANKNSQTECSFAVLDSTNIVAGFMNTHLSEYQLGFAQFPGIPSPRMTSWAVSTNAGTNFTDKGPIPPISTITNGTTVITNGASNPIYGDAGDTTMAYDSRSNVVYLLLNPSREETNWYGFRLWASTNKGQSFTPINMDVPGLDSHGNHLVYEGDKPMLKVNQTNLYVAGSTTAGPHLWAASSSDGGTNWGSFTNLESISGGDVRGADIAIIPDGTVYFFWLRSLGTNNQFRYAWLSTNNVWSAATNIGPQLNTTNTSANGSGDLLRYNGTNDYFTDNAFPHVTYANGFIYIAYADVSSPTNTTDRGDIFLIESQVLWTNHSLNVTAGPRKVNNDGTQTDQWDPSIAANPAGTELFIGYYSRQNDPVTNSWIKAYGAKAYITNGLAAATFECIPIGPTSFQPFFAGTLAASNNVSTFDPVWPASNACIDTNDVWDGWYVAGTANYCPPGILGPFPNGTDNEYVHFCADDYTWCGADSNYFYFAWCDRTRTYQNTRPDADIKFAKIKQ